MKEHYKKIKTLAAILALSVAVCFAASCNTQTADQDKTSEASVGEKISEATDVSSAGQSEAVSTAEQSSGESAASASEVSEIIGPSPAESGTSLPAAESSVEASNAESSISYGTEQMAHPNDLVGKWSLKLDTTQLSGSDLSSAEDRMAHTSIVLNLDGSAAGIYGDATVRGAWGVQNGYIYIVIGEATEVFVYDLDTLVSVNYEGMSFVK